MKKVTLMRDFIADQRISMERYADGLAASLNSPDAGSDEVAEYQPQVTKNLPQWLKMRFARYVSYPQQARALDSDVYHIVDHGYAHLLKTLPANRTVISVHDIIPLLAGRGLVAGVKLRRNWLAEYSFTYIRRAAGIIAVSDSTKNDLIKYCRCDPERIHVVPPGLDAEFTVIGGESTEQLRDSLGLSQQPVKLVLITGGEHYKNHVTSLKTVALLQQQYGSNIALVRLGGSSQVWQNAITASGYTGQLIELSGLTQQQLVRLYNAVDCLLFPSWYEGFGWPPLEAMACGTPVVTSNRASLPEVVGEAYPTFEADDTQAMANAIDRLLFDPEHRATHIEKGFQQAQKFNWNNTANQILNVYNTIR